MTLDEFFPYVLPEVIGCPEPLLRSVVRLTAIDFCDRSQSWVEFSDPLPLVNDVKDYDLDVPTGASARTVRDVWIGSRRLRPVSMAALQEALPDWPTAQGNEPIFYNMPADPGVLRVYPTPVNVSGQALLARTVFVPTISATTLPAFLGQQWVEVIAAGAKSRLMLMAGSSWANPALGAYYKQIFDAGVTDARIEEAHERVPGTLTVVPRSFGF